MEEMVKVNDFYVVDDIEKGRVKADWTGTIHDCYLNPNEHWNGFACPYFPVTEIPRIIDILPEDEWFEGPLIDEDGSLVIKCFQGSGELTETWRACAYKGQLVFPIGAWGWAWSLVD